MLDLTRILAGPVGTRALAAYGAVAGIEMAGESGRDGAQRED